MCGIAGLVQSKKSLGVNPAMVVTAMTDALAHRGPDGDGFFSDEQAGVYLGHRRLAILDLSEKGRQPMRDTTDNLVITFNGEIYNYKEILTELGSPQTKSGTDTEMILLAYKKWGQDCVLKFRGMFAFAIYDRQAQTIFLARDHFGQKPLFYSVQEGGFYFCSEITPLMRSLPAKPAVNPAALLSFFVHNFRHVPDPYTIYRGIRALEPGMRMVFDMRTGDVIVSNYLRADYAHKFSASANMLVGEYKKILKECVELTTISDVPVGLLLSGGVDSSSIASVLAGKKIKSFAVGSGSEDDELERAKQVAKICGTDHTEIIMDRVDFSDMVEVVRLAGQPYNLLSAVFSMQIVKVARAAGIKVLIGGNGADEIFYGYDGAGKLRALSGLLALLPGHEKIGAAVKPYIYRKKAKNILRALFSTDIAVQLKNFDPGELIHRVEGRIHKASLIERNYFAGLMLENQHSVTTIADITGMSHGVEIRTPFLDPNMFNFAAQLPIRMKVPDFFGKNKNKYIMRKALESLLNPKIAWASKKGFGFHFNLHDLIVGKWKKEVEQILFTVVSQSSFFNPQKIQQLWDRCLAGDRSQTSIVWGLVSFGIFMKEIYYV